MTDQVGPLSEREAHCPRGELVVAIHTLASHFENSLYAFRADTEARRKAEGDIAHAMKIAAKYNYNGPSCEASRAPVVQPADARETIQAALNYILHVGVERKPHPQQQIVDGLQAILAAAPSVGVPLSDERRRAPWPDFMGQPIRHGDRLEHPNGQAFTAVWLNAHDSDGEAWRAIYDDATVSRLCLQIGDKGRAVLAASLEKP